MRVKICGVRLAGDAELAARHGASHLGCVLAPDSPRRASTAQVRAVRRAVSPEVTVVLVLRAARADDVLRACDATGVHTVQLHGTSPALHAELRARGLRTYAAHAVPPTARRLPALRPTPQPVQPAVLDVGQGGSGRAFDWRLLVPRAPADTLIAGGIHTGNLPVLLRYRPWGIDVSSGVELSPGRKDSSALRRLLELVHER